MRNQDKVRNQDKAAGAQGDAPRSASGATGNIERLPPSEHDLHAFVDDELPLDQRLHVIEWLLCHQNRARDVFDMQLREDMLRTAARIAARAEDEEPAMGLLAKLQLAQFRIKRNSFAWLAGAFVAGAAFALFVLALML